MSIVRFSLRQSVLVHLLFVVGILAGGFVVVKMNVDVYPEEGFA